MRSARTDLVDLEEFTDKELDDLEEDFRNLRQEFLEKRAKAIETKLKHHQ
jgi:hypothetical protein